MRDHRRHFRDRPNRLTVLWRRGGAFSLVLAAFVAGIGAYAASMVFWSLLLVLWPWLLAGAAAVMAVGAWWLWWGLPKRQVNQMRLADPKQRADLEDNFRKTAGQLIGGAAVL